MPLLVIGGIANLAAMSITQTVVQLRAPSEKKGQVIGVDGVAANGMRIGSGFTVGLPSLNVRRPSRNQPGSVPSAGAPEPGSA